MEGWKMSVRFLRWTLFAVLALTALPVQADWLCDFFNSIPQETKRRNCWPKPFVCPDRQAVRAPLAIQVSNGWRRQNLLSDLHFDPKNGELTEAGRLKIQWIAFEAPEQHRMIYVRNAINDEETVGRVNAVNGYLAKIMPQGVLPTVSTTRISDDNWPAEQVENINKKWESTIPSPRLPSGGLSSVGQQ
jgi:hypothetical protein